jgi:predicted XRE-type DNA-binding protein
MAIVGRGVREFRIHYEGEYRVIYVATYQVDQRELAMGNVTKSSGNVFEDLGFDASEAENLKLRAQLMRELEILIHDQRLTQSEAAELLGIHQSRVSDLVRGKIDRFSIDMLVKLLAKAGRQVEIKVKLQAA